MLKAKFMEKNIKQPKSVRISVLLIWFVVLRTSVLKNSELGQHFRSLLFNLWGGQQLKQREMILKRARFALWL